MFYFKKNFKSEKKQTVTKIITFTMSYSGFRKQTTLFIVINYNFKRVTFNNELPVISSFSLPLARRFVTRILLE